MGNEESSITLYDQTSEVDTPDRVQEQYNPMVEIDKVSEEMLDDFAEEASEREQVLEERNNQVGAYIYEAFSTGQNPERDDYNGIPEYSFSQLEEMLPWNASANLSMATPSEFGGYDLEPEGSKLARETTLNDFVDKWAQELESAESGIEDAHQLSISEGETLAKTVFAQIIKDPRKASHWASEVHRIADEAVESVGGNKPPVVRNTREFFVSSVCDGGFFEAVNENPRYFFYSAVNNPDSSLSREVAAALDTSQQGLEAKAEEFRGFLEGALEAARQAGDNETANRIEQALSVPAKQGPNIIEGDYTIR